MLQMYSDRSKTTIKVSRLNLYPLHINVRIFIESMQDMMCSHTHILLAFLPVEFINKINVTYVENNMLPQLDSLKKVHPVIAQLLKPLPKKAVRGIQCPTKEQKPVRLHFVLGSYSADIPEQKEMIGVEPQNATVS